MNLFKSVLDATDKFEGTKILCVGEVVLDRFIYSYTKRLSSEAPIPVFLHDEEKSMLGATGNVVSNLSALNADITLVSVQGQNDQDRVIAQKLREQNIKSNMILDKDRVTTIKTRFTAKGQQVFRFDREIGERISKDIEDQIIKRVSENVGNVKVMILSEYNQGILTERVIKESIAMANKANIPVVIDPRGNNYSKYKGATIVTPNTKELETLLGYEINGEEELYNAALKVMKENGIENLLVTRDKEGMTLVLKDKTVHHIPARPVKVLEVSGAGDTVITGLALSIANGEDFYTSCYIANAAAGVAIGKYGTATVNKQELISELKEIRTYEQK